jgi:hypothetical protein
MCIVTPLVAETSRGRKRDDRAAFRRDVNVDVL